MDEALARRIIKIRANINSPTVPHNGRRKTQRTRPATWQQDPPPVRSAQKMLCFICDAEMDGRAGELSEYLIGVEVFGRPSSYSPVEDSIVRTRAYELRNKLTRFYAMEAPDASIRVEIERGAYVPRFIRNTNVRVAAVASKAPADVAPAEPMPPSVTTGRLRAALILSCCVSVVLAALLFLNWSQRTKGPQADAWTPDMKHSGNRSWPTTRRC